MNRKTEGSAKSLRIFICQKMAFKLANKLRQISHFVSQILTTHLPAFLLPSLEITFFLRSFSMRYLTILIERPMVTIWNLLGDADPDTVRILQHLSANLKSTISNCPMRWASKKRLLGKRQSNFRTKVCCQGKVLRKQVRGR